MKNGMKVFYGDSVYACINKADGWIQEQGSAFELVGHTHHVKTHKDGHEHHYVIISFKSNGKIF